MKELRVKVGSIELQVRDYEHGGEAIICLHFSGANLMMWQGIVPYFQDRYRLILVDLRGHGKSDKPHSSYHIDEMAGDVLGVMQEIQLEKAHVIGSSLGAEVGLSLAANHPERVISLVCDGALNSEYGPYGVWEGTEAAFEEDVAKQISKVGQRPDAAYGTVDELLAARKKLLEEYGWWNQNVEAMNAYDVYPTEDGRFRRGFPTWALQAYLEHYFRYRFEDYYRKVTCPVLMVPGEEELQDEKIKRAMQGLCKLAADGRIAEVPGWIHPYGWLLDPEGISKVVLDFLEGNKS